MQKSAEIFWQTSPDIYSIDNIAQSSFFYTVIWLTIIMSHHYLPIQIINFFLKLINIIGKITLFCISICIMKHLKQKTQNNWFLTQIIVPPPTHTHKKKKLVKSNHLANFYSNYLDGDIVMMLVDFPINLIILWIISILKWKQRFYQMKFVVFNQKRKSLLHCIS